MGEIFIGLAKRVGIFLIAGQTILHFGVGKQYERYVKLVISLMVVAQMVFGFGGLVQESLEGGLQGMFSQDFERRWEENILQFEKEMVKKQEQIEQKLAEEQAETSPEEDGFSGIIIEEIKVGN